MQDYVDANPGLSHATAYHLLMQKRPELFTDEQGRDPIERDTLYRDNQKKQQAIRDEIAKMQDADKNLPFTVAWRLLIKQKPQLFDFEEPKRRTEPEEPATSTASNPGVETGKRLIRAAMGAKLRQKVEALREERPELSFADAWALCRKEEPGLFGQVRAIENGNWPEQAENAIPARKAIRISAKRDSEVFVVQGGFATRLT